MDTLLKDWKAWRDIPQKCVCGYEKTFKKVNKGKDVPTVLIDKTSGNIVYHKQGCPAGVQSAIKTDVGIFLDYLTTKQHGTKKGKGV